MSTETWYKWKIIEPPKDGQLIWVQTGVDDRKLIEWSRIYSHWCAVGTGEKIDLYGHTEWCYFKPKSELKENSKKPGSKTEPVLKKVKAMENVHMILSSSLTSYTRGAKAGGSAQFLREIAELLLTKAAKAGFITPVTADNPVAISLVAAVLPMIGQFAQTQDWVPMGEKIAAVSKSAIAGQGALHGALLASLASEWLKEVLELPSASVLKES